MYKCSQCWELCREPNISNLGGGTGEIKGGTSGSAEGVGGSCRWDQWVCRVKGLGALKMAQSQRGRKSTAEELKCVSFTSPQGYPLNPCKHFLDRVNPFSV